MKFRPLVVYTWGVASEARSSRETWGNLRTVHRARVTTIAAATMVNPASPRLAPLHDPQHVAHHLVELEVLRRVDGGDAGFLQRGGVVGRDDAADHDRHAVEAGVAQARDHVLDQRHVR